MNRDLRRSRDLASALIRHKQIESVLSLIGLIIIDQVPNSNREPDEFLDEIWEAMRWWVK